MARMAFFVNGGGVPDFLPIKTTVGTILVMFDTGARTLYQSWTVGVGNSYFSSAGSGSTCRMTWTTIMTTRS